MRRVGYMLVAAGVVAAGMVACSTGDAGHPVPAGSATSAPSFQDPSGSASSGSGAPKVGQPMDIARFAADPCSAISTTLLKRNGYVAPGDKGTDPYGTTCGWESTQSYKSVAIGFPKPLTLDQFYRGRGAGSDAYFEPTTVSGYPGVFSDLTDRRSGGTCKLIVAPNDSALFSVLVLTGPQDGCGEAKKLAAAVITTVKGQG